MVHRVATSRATIASMAGLTGAKSVLPDEKAVLTDGAGELSSWEVGPQPSRAERVGECYKRVWLASKPCLQHK